MHKLTKLFLAYLTLATANQSYAMFDVSKWSFETKLGLGLTGLGISCLCINSARKWFLTPPLNYPKNYSINLMWINREVDVNQAHIYPSNNKNGYGKQFLTTILAWMKKNPENTVSVWFDSQLITKHAVENTQRCINQEVAKYKEKIAKIELKDIRNLTKVKKNPEVFSPEIPVYFRTDLLRAIIMDESIRQNKDSYFVYSDFDVKPLTKTQLFDKKTLENLNKYNFVMAHESNALKFENSFQIFTYNEKLLKAVKLMVINANISRAQSFIEDIKEKSEPGSIFSGPKAWRVHEIGFQENVFYSYPLMYTYFCQLQDSAMLTFRGSDKTYDKKRDGKELLNTNAKVLMAKSSALRHLANFPMPSKKVSLPASTSAFSELLKAQ